MWRFSLRAGLKRASILRSQVVSSMGSGMSLRMIESEYDNYDDFLNLNKPIKDLDDARRSVCAARGFYFASFVVVRFWRGCRG